MRKAWLIAVVAAAAATVLPPLAGCRQKGRADQLTIYCAAGLRDPMIDLARVFEQDHAPATVRIDYAGSGELLGRLRTASAPEYRPDIFIAADESYAQQAQALGLVDRTETLAYFVPVIAVLRGNPSNIHSLADLGRTDVKVALGEPRGPAIGLVTDRILEKAGLMSVRKKAVGTFATVQAVATQVAPGIADAAIIWDAVARQGDFQRLLETIPLPDAPAVRIVICRVAQCPHPRLADDFIRLATTTDLARGSFQKHGFTVKLPTASFSAPTTRGEP